MTTTRKEHDSFGDIDVPADRLWGAQTQRSLQHFLISTEKMPIEFIHALLHVKSACAQVNADLGLLEVAKARAIQQAADELVSSNSMIEFPLAIWQTGSGTQTNMNANEVLANRGSEILGGQRGKQRLIHANDHVNLGQSSNDIFPTAMHVAIAVNTQHKLLPVLQALIQAFASKVAQFNTQIKVGRTHLQDATPLTLGQEFSAFVAQLEQAQNAIQASMHSVYALAVGGTAVGTGINTHAEFGQRVAQNLANKLALPFHSDSNKFALLAAHDGVAHVHASFKLLAIGLNKIANDLRLLASGPRCGIGELLLPENEPGSSIMPGKVNPTQCEAMTMVCVQVLANDVAVGMAGASGHLQLNTYKPLIMMSTLQSIRLLSDAMTCFDHYCVSGLQLNKERVDELLQRSLMMVTALAPSIGYERAAMVAKKAHAEKITLREAALVLGFLNADELDRLLDPAKMV